MSNTFSYEDAIQQQPNTFSYEDAFGDDPPKKKSRTWGEAFKDTGAALAGGVTGLVKTAGDLYGLASGDMDNAVSELGRSGQEYWEDAKSNVLKAKIAQRKKDIDAQESTLGKAWTAVKDTVTDPALAVDTVAENAATMLPGMAAGRLAAGARMASGLRFGPLPAASQLALEQGAGRIGTGVAVGVGAAQQGADVSGDIYSDVMKKPDAAWDANPEFAQELERNGGDREAAKRELAMQTARASFLPAAGVSVLANAMPGASMLERALVGGAARETIEAGTKYALPKAIAKGALGEGAQEFVEEGGGRLAANIAAQNYADPSHDTWDQVGENAGMGAAGGLLMGGVGGALHRQQQDVTKPPTDSTTLGTETNLPADMVGGGNAKSSAQALLGRNPDAGQQIIYPDGTIAYRSEMENAIRNLPEDQQIEARARLAGYALQPVKPEDTPSGQASQRLPVTGPLSQVGKDSLDIRAEQEASDANSAQAEQAAIIEQQLPKPEPKTQQQRLIELQKLVSDYKQAGLPVPQEQIERELLIDILELPRDSDAKYTDLVTQLGGKQSREFNGLVGALASFSLDKSNAAAPTSQEQNQAPTVDDITQAADTEVQTPTLPVTQKITQSEENALRDKLEQANPFKTFLRKYGISDSPSDVIGDNAFKSNQVLPRTFRNNGMPLDLLAEKAVEYGFITQNDFDSGDGVAIMTNMIQNEINGKKNYPIQDQTQVAQRKYDAGLDEYQLASLQYEANKLGIPFDDNTDPVKLNDQIKRIERKIKKANTWVEQQKQRDATLPDLTQDEAIVAQEFVSDDDGNSVPLSLEDIETINRYLNEQDTTTSPVSENPAPTNSFAEEGAGIPEQNLETSQPGSDATTSSTQAEQSLIQTDFSPPPTQGEPYGTNPSESTSTQSTNETGQNSGQRRQEGLLDQQEVQQDAQTKPAVLPTKASNLSEAIANRKAEEAAVSQENALPLGEAVSTFTGKHGKGMGLVAAKQEAQRLNSTSDGSIVYAAEEHSNSNLEHPYAVVGRRIQAQQAATPDVSTQTAAPITQQALQQSEKRDATPENNTVEATENVAPQYQEPDAATWQSMTPEQRRRNTLERAIATGMENNGGVMVKLRPAAIAMRKQQLAAMGDAGLMSNATPATITSTQPEGVTNGNEATQAVETTQEGQAQQSKVVDSNTNERPMYDADAADVEEGSVIGSLRKTPVGRYLINTVKEDDPHGNQKLNLLAIENTRNRLQIGSDTSHMMSDDLKATGWNPYLVLEDAIKHVQQQPVAGITPAAIPATQAKGQAPVEAIEASVQAFADTRKGLQKQQAIKALDKTVKGQQTPIKAFVYNAVQDGATVQGEGDSRILSMKDGGQFTVEQLTNYGMDYAQWLIERKVDAKAEQSDSDPNSFVPAPDGSIDYGEITPEMAKAMRRQGGKIRLQQGVQNSDGTGYGLTHIESNHGDQIRGLGYKDIPSFVTDAVRNFDEIWKPKITSQIVAIVSDKKGRAIYLQLSPATDEGGDFYRVNSAFPVSKGYAHSKEKKEGWKPLWSRYPVPADASGASGFVGQSPNAGGTTLMVSSQSGDSSIASPAPESKPAATTTSAIELTRTTPEQVKADEERAAKAEKDKAKADKDAENKAKADAEQAEFTLTGSDRPADVAEAAGQGALFDAPKVDKQESQTKPQPEDAKDSEGNRIFKVGDRVALKEEYAFDSEVNGRHGEVIKATPMVMTIIDLLGKSRGSSKTTYHYEVKTDGGHVVYTQGSMVEAETGNAPKATPDILIDKRHETPGSVLRSIEYARSRQRVAEGKLMRSKSLKSTQEWTAEIKAQKDKIAQLSAAFDAWAKANPEAAQALQPKTEAVAPVAASSPVPANGMYTVTKTKHTKTGADIWVAKTTVRHDRAEYDRINSVAKRNGGMWSNFTKGFNFSTEAGANDFLKAVNVGTNSTPSKVEVLGINEVKLEGNPYVYGKGEQGWYWRSAGADNGARNRLKSDSPIIAQTEAALDAKSRKAEPVTPEVKNLDDLNAMFDTILAEEIAKDEAKKNKDGDGQQDELDSEMRGYERNPPKTLQTAIDKHKAEEDAQNKKTTPVSNVVKAATDSGRLIVKHVGDAPNPTTPTVTQSLTDAAKNTASGLSNAIDALGALFGGNGTLRSGLTFDEQTYAQAKPLFQAALSNFKDAGNNLTEAMRTIVRMVMEKFGAQAADKMKPYVVQFIADVRDGKVEIAPKNADTVAKDNTTNASTTQPKNVPAGTAPSDQSNVANGNRNIQPMATGMAENSQGTDSDRGISGGTQAPGGRGNQNQAGHQPKSPIELGEGRGNGANPESASSINADGTGRGAGGRGRSAVAESAPTDSTSAGSDSRIKDSEGLRGVSGNDQGQRTAQGLDESVTDHVINADDIGKGGLTKKYRDNVAAIKVLKTLEAEGRAATPQERDVLARYVGWGALKGAFDPDNTQWAKQHAELKELLTEAEFKAARRSTLDAHYTSPIAIKAMYDAMERLGFKGGRILEPSVGSGNFFGMMPSDIRRNSQLNGVELDSLTSRLVAALYPTANIAKATGFQDYIVPSEYFDAVIGNPPFGSQPIVDSNRSPYSGFSIHNYFLAKGIDKLRPGGIMQVVVSHNFLDAQDGRVRKWIGERANLIGAVRMPNTAFKENAGTEVVTDILVFQKKTAAEISDKQSKQPWQNVVDQTNVNQKTGESFTHKVNQFFAERPQFVLGNPSAAGSMYHANEYTVEANGNLKEQLAGWVDSLPKNIYTAIDRVTTKNQVDISIPDGVKPGSFYVDDSGTIMQRGEDVLGDKTAMSWKAPNTKSEARMNGMIVLRDTLRKQMRLERSIDATETEIETNRDKLNKQYDSFLKEFGHVNNQVNRRIFMDDTESHLVQALEFDYDKGISDATAKAEGIEARAPKAVKADIFSRRVAFPPSDFMKVETSKDALLASLNYRGKVDVDYMSQVLDKPIETIVKELGDAVFDDPQIGIVSADEYLSGDVKTKLEEAKAAALKDKQYQRNVTALEAVIPKDKTPSDIYASIGAPWVPPEIYQQFIKHISGGDAVAYYLKATGQWLIDFKGNTTSSLNRGKFGTSKLSAEDLFNLSINGRGAVVKETIKHADGSTSTIVLEKETEMAREKQNAIKAEWNKWIWEDATRADQLTNIYNDKMNRIVNRKFDGSHLTFPGLNPTLPLLQHQQNGVWRGLQTSQILYDHVVGAGKTFTMAAQAMEMRRLGMARKPLFVVPNHLTLQWRSEFMRLYPGANILAATPEDFSADRRERMFSKIITGDWDAVIIGHSSLKKIGLPEATERAVMQEQIDEVADAIYVMKRERGDKNIIRDMEKIKSNLEAKFHDKLANIGKRSKVVTFDELGVDAMFLDEAHEFKNLAYISTMDRNPGMGNPSGSTKAFDLFVKARWLFDTFGKKTPFVAATGTPVSNSLVEMYNMQRYMQYPTLKEQGLHVFDAWAKHFGSIENVYEVAPSGSGYRQSSRFAKFTNLPALMGLYNTFADTITLDDLRSQEEAKGKKFPVPNIVGGRQTLIVAKRSPAVAERMGIPKVEIGEDGKVLFGIDLSQGISITKDDATGKFTAKIGNESLGSFDTKQDARLKIVEKALTPNVSVDPNSILGRFSRLRELTKETKGKVNALSLTGEANKLGLDYRLIDPSAPDFAGSKINLAVDNMLRIYHQWEADKGTQLVFCDLSVPLTARAGYTNKERRLYVRNADNAIEMKRGTMHTVTGHEQLPFFVVQRGTKDLKRFDVYDAASGVQIKGDFRTKNDAIDTVTGYILDDAKRQRWIEVSGSQQIQQDEIDEYNNANDVETEGMPTFTLDDVAGMSGASKFSVYDDIKAKLITKGVPEHEIAFIHDYSTPTAKDKLFKAVKEGDIRFLLGSTQKMGAGTNVQDRLVGLHHIDAPWRPSDLEQREGRIIRRGNKLYERDPEGFAVFIGRYATEQTYDTRRWQILEHKARGIEQLRNYDGTSNEIDDVDGEAANAADMKAAASGDPLILEETKLRNEVTRLERLQTGHADEALTMTRKAKDAEYYATKTAPGFIAQLEDMIETTAASKPNKDGWSNVTIDGAVHSNRDDALKTLESKVSVLRSGLSSDHMSIQYRGIGFDINYQGAGSFTLDAPTERIGLWMASEPFSASGFVQRLRNYTDRLPDMLENAKDRTKQSLESAKTLREQANKPFTRGDELNKAREDYKNVRRALMSKGVSVPENQKPLVAAAMAEQRAALERLGYGDALREVAGSNGIQQSRTTTQAPNTPITAIRSAITQAYGNLLGKLEGRGLMQITQTQDEAIEAAAKARAKMTGESVATERATLMESVNKSAAMRLWIGSRTINDFLIPETEEYEGSTTGDLAYVSGNDKVPKGPLRVTEGRAPESHRGRGIRHMADNATSQPSRMPQRITGDLAEDLMREAVTVMRGVTQVHEDDSAFIFVNNSMRKAIVAQWRGNHYSVISVRPFQGNPKNLWGNSDWNGRLTFPIPDNLATSSSEQITGATRPNPSRSGQEVKSERFNLTSSEEKKPTVTYKKSRKIDIKRSTSGHIQGFFDPVTGKSFLIANNLTAEAAPGVLIHEIGIHMGADGSLDKMYARAKTMTGMNKGNQFFDEVARRMQEAGETSGEEYAAYITELYERDRDNAPNAVKQWFKDLLATVRAWLFKRGMLVKAEQLTEADIAAIARSNARSMSVGRTSDGIVKFSKSATVINQSGGKIPPMSPSPAKTPLYEAIRQLSRFEDSFQTGTSDSKDLSVIAREMTAKDKRKSKKFTVEKSTALQHGKRKQTLALNVELENKNVVKLLDIFDSDTDRPFVVIGNEDAGKGVGGATAYQIAFAWAHNNGKTMRPDPAGITQINRLRRTEAMISSAMHYGTTKHLEPHQDQYVALLDRMKKGGVEPEDTSLEGRPDIYAELTDLKEKFWKKGDSPAIIASNVQHLLETSTRLAHSRETALRHFEVANGVFRVRNGREGALHLANLAVADEAEKAQILGAVLQPAITGVGNSTLRRAAVSMAIGREFQRALSDVTVGQKDNENRRSDVVALQAIRRVFGRLDLSTPDSLRGVIYSRATGRDGLLRVEDKQPDALWYSELSRQVQSNKSNSMPAGMWKAWIDSLTTKGVSQADVQWSGVKDYLAQQQGKISKDELLNQIDTNGKRVQNAIVDAVDNDFEGIIKRMKAAGVLEVECD